MRLITRADTPVAMATTSDIEKPRPISLRITLGRPPGGAGAMRRCPEVVDFPPEFKAK